MKEYYWLTDFKIHAILDPKDDFHPWGYKGTEEDYNRVTRKYIEDNDLGKIAAVHKFETIEELNKFRPSNRFKKDEV